MDDRIKAMKGEYPDYIPVSVNFLPATWKKYREELSLLVKKYPLIFGCETGKPKNYDEVHGTYQQGEHRDVWGCVWSNLHEGMEAIVTHHPVPKREDVHTLTIPKEDGGLPHGFMYLRLLDLRGFEEIMIDFYEEPKELSLLIDKVLEYNLLQLEKLLATKPSYPILFFGDDLGMQHSLPISPNQWRTYLKPCYQKIYRRCHEEGYYVYMHTDGHILPIIPDLKECGVDVLNPQIGANGLEGLVATCKDVLCVNLDLDRQQFPFLSPYELDLHVRDAVCSLGSKKGGLWLSAECGPDVPLENIEAICEALLKYRGFFR